MDKEIESERRRYINGDIITKEKIAECLIYEMCSLEEIINGTPECIAAARSAYNSLNNNQKAQVSEKTLAALEEAERVSALKVASFSSISE